MKFDVRVVQRGVMSKRWKHVWVRTNSFTNTILATEADTTTAQVETLLKTQDPADAVYGNGDQNFSHMDISSLPDFNAPPSDHGISSMLYVVEKQRAESQNDGSLPIPDKSRLDTTLDTSQLPDMMGEPSLSWDMMQMGLDEALPEPNVIDDL